jgi:Zn-dependent peptidase ImmA (M78 family)
MIPLKFNLIDKEISVEISDSIRDYYCLNGHCIIDKGLIQVQSNNPSLPPEEMELTFLHELVHMILMTIGYTKISDDEQFVELFARCFHQYKKTAIYPSAENRKLITDD